MSNQRSAAAGASAPAATDDADDTARKIQVLEFELGGETYCVDIDYVSEIVDRGSVTPVPNAPDFVEGVMDLRGRTTSIVDPKTLLNVGTESEAQRIVIFDADSFEMDRGEFIKGIVRREDGLVVWVTPTKTAESSA